MHLTNGSLVGPYRILAAVGAGGMGEVYRARDEKLNRDVALKVLSADLASSSEHLRRFEQEARAASALNHPNIIAIYDIGRSADGLAYIAMEMVEGEDLRNLAGGAPLPLKQVLRVAVKVADGLATAHERGIVHRDLKPENVMVSRDGFVKILDFGLAKLAVPVTDSDATVPHTTPGAVFGTVGYMSPEQASGRPADFRSDQFALGVMLYEMLTGRLPFSEPTAAETLAAIIRRDPRPIENPNVPPELIRIVSRCLAKEPVERYASTRDLARDLRELRDRSSHSSEGRYRTGPLIEGGIRSARVRWLAIAAALSVLLVAGVVATRQRHDPGRDAGPKSVAILPFRDLTGTPDGQIFTDGLTDMIGTRLVQSRRIRVMPPAPGDDKQDPGKLARQKGAAFALTGNVQRVGHAVHVGYALIDAASGEQIAGETLNGEEADVFDLEERAVNSILAAMHVSPEATGRSSSSELSSAADQNDYVAALGLLQRARDEQSIDQAITILERLLRNARDSAMVNAQLARALLYKAQLSRRPGLIEQATIYAERAVEIDGSQPEIHIRLGQLRAAAGRYQDADNEYRRALALRPDDADAILGLATAAEAMGHAADAEQKYQKAIALRPTHGNSYNLYGAFLFKNGRYAEAAQNFLRFTQLDPTARGYSNLASAYQAMGQYERARLAYEKSIALGPYSDVYLNLGELNYYTANFDAAAKALQEAVALSPSSYPAWLSLGNSYRWSTNMRDRSKDAYENAVKTAREAAAVNARDAVAHATAANALAKLGRLQEAEAELNRALKLDPTNQDVLYSAGVVAMLRGNTSVAIGWLQRAVGAGYPLNNLEHDPELKAAHADPAFPRQMARKE